MRMRLLLCFLITGWSMAPAAAEDVKMEVGKVAEAYSENFNKQNAAGIAALYASGGLLVNATGPHSDIEKTYEGVFKAGFTKDEIRVDQVWALGADTALAMGEFRISGQNPSGTPIEVVGFWTATDVREGGTWKIKMLTAFPKAPPPK